MSNIDPLGPSGFRWDPSWAPSFGYDGTSSGWAHHGIVVTRDDRIITFAVDRPEVLVFDRAGALLDSWTADVVEGHGLFLAVDEDDQEYLWISDIGTKNRPVGDGGYLPDAEPARGAVVKTTLTGREVARIEAPPLEVYRDGSFSPSQVAVEERRSGGSGDVWVADCYGQALVHRFDEHGRLVATLTGEDGGGRFAHPHAVFIDRRRREPELLVTDRRNKRIQVFDLEGRWQRNFGADEFVSPGGFAQYGSELFVTELDSRITILSSENEVVGYLGAAGPRSPGWPNALDGQQHPVRPPLIEGRMHTPHAAAFDSDGNLYVAEWLIGGRLERFERLKVSENVD